MTVSNLTAIALAGDGPFLHSPFWPPVDETGMPKPALFLCLSVLGFIMYRLFYGDKMAKLKLEVLERKKVMRIAQATSIIISQQSEFSLTKEQAEQLREQDPENPTIFQGSQDLTVKGSVYVPMLVDPSSFGLGRLSDEDAPPLGQPEMYRLTSGKDQPISFDSPLKGRELVVVKWDRGEAQVSTTQELEEVFSRLTDDDFPAKFVIESAKPEAERLYGLVIDKVYQEKTAEQSVYSDSEKARFNLIEKLLRHRVLEEMEEGIVKTLQARKMEGSPPLLDKEVKMLPPFQSGEKLKDLVRLVTGSRHGPGIHDFLPGVVPDDTLLLAKDVLGRIRASQSSSYVVIWRLLAPSLPYWLLSCIVQALLEIVVAQLGGSTFAAKVSELIMEEKITTNDVNMLSLQVLAGWAVLIVFGWVSAGLLDGKAQRLFAQTIKTRALKSLLGQDFEYFDKHSAGSLNGRLNGDADMLKRNLLGLTKSCITEATAILANAYLVYRMCPLDMFLAAMLPLPFIAYGQIRLVKKMRVWDRQSHFMREDAEANIGQILGEIKTVRDFSMESKEVERYQRSTEFLAQVEENHAAKSHIFGWGMHFLHVVGQQMTIVIGVSKVASGELKPSDLILAIGMISGMVGGKLRGMVDRVRELAYTAEPAGRICELIQTSPTIEPNKADHVQLIEDVASAKAVFASLSCAGEVTDEFGLESVGVACGAKAMSLSTATGQVITIDASGLAMWEVCGDQRVPFCTSPDVKTQVMAPHALKADQKVRAKQVGRDWAQDEGGLFLPLHVTGMRALRLVIAEKAQLLQFIDHEPACAFPMKLFFSRKLVPSKFRGEIEFQQVEFRYPTELRVPALREMSFKVDAGTIAAIVGKAGCGKSTVFKLIKRLYDPTSGQVLLDGKPLQQYDVRHLRRKIAVVAQDNVLFDTTIRENVAYGIHPEPTEDEVRRALEQASALEFVEAFPDNIYTLVGGRGLTLSGGQRQRIAIARAMVRQPQILILDEATSALDPVNEKIVQRALDALVETTKATALLIAHRLTTIKDADKIIVLDEGRVVEQGTHAELLEIPIMRHEAKTQQKEGVIKTGYYHAQWNNMMGDSGEDQNGQLAGLAILQAENERLRWELAVERRRNQGFTCIRHGLCGEEEFQRRVASLTVVPGKCHSPPISPSIMPRFPVDDFVGLPLLSLERAKTVI